MKFVEKIKKLPAFLKGIKKENLNNIVTDTKMINEQIEEVFYDAVGTKDISYYRLELLNKKIALLEKSLQIQKENFQKYGEDVNKIDFVRFFSSSLLIIVGVPLIIFTQTAIYYWIFYTIYMLFQFYTLSLVRNFKNHKNAEELFESHNNALVSCKNILGKKLADKKELISEKVVQKDCSIEILANKVISDYLENNSLCIPSKEVEEQVVKMLQHELRSDSDELIILLNEARKAVDSEKKYSDMGRIRKKNAEEIN